MLPRLLCEELCSLNPNAVTTISCADIHPFILFCTYVCIIIQDRLVFSVVWCLTNQCEVCVP